MNSFILNNSEGQMTKGAQYMDTMEAIELNKKQLEQFNVTPSSSAATTPSSATPALLADRGPLSITITSMERAKSPPTHKSVKSPQPNKTDRPHTAPASGRAYQSLDSLALDNSYVSRSSDLDKSSQALKTDGSNTQENEQNSERKPIKYDGIGPMDRETGMPVGLRMVRL